MNSRAPEMIYPDWPAPTNVRAVSTTRLGGGSLPPFDSFNLGDHVGDEVGQVATNRAILAEAMHVPVTQIQWMKQIHGTHVYQLDQVLEQVEADAATTRRVGLACAIMTADCLPVLFASLDGCQVAAAHAGWRGLSGGVLQKTLAQFTNPANVMVWLGPAIGSDAFEVGEDVLQAFCDNNPATKAAFIAVQDKPGKYLADLYRLAQMILETAGVGQVYGGGRCTYTDVDHFYSFRRDGVTGRMATLIWKTA